MKINELSKYVSSNILVKDTFAYTLINLGSRFLSLLALPFLSSVLTLEDYGVIGIGIATFNLLAIITQLGFDQTFQRIYLELKEHQSRSQLLSLWLFNALLALTGTAVLFVLAYILISFFMVIPPVYVECIVYVYLALVFYYPMFIALTWYRTQSKSKYVVLLLSLQTITQISLSVIFIVLFHYPVRFYFIAFFISYLVSGIPAILMLRKSLTFSVSFTSALNTSTLKFGWPLLLSFVSNWFILQSSPYFITAFSGREQTGLFHIANSLASMLMLLTWSFQQAFNPYALTKYGQIKEDAFPFFRKTFELYILLFSAALFSAVLFSKEIILLLTNESFIQAAPAFGVLLLSNICSGLMYFVALPFLLQKKSVEYGIINISTALLAAIGMVLLIPLYGHLGGAIAICLATATGVLFIQARAKKTLNLSFPFIKGMVVLLAVFATAMLMDFYNISVLVRAAVLLFVLWFACSRTIHVLQTKL